MEFMKLIFHLPRRCFSIAMSLYLRLVLCFYYYFVFKQITTLITLMKIVFYIPRRCISIGITLSLSVVSYLFYYFVFKQITTLIAFMKLLFYLPSRCISIAITPFLSLVSCLNYKFDYPILVKLADAFLSLYFLVFCDLRPITVDLDDGKTTVHFWVSGHHRKTRPNLVMLHGYGGNSKWQFIHQVSDLSKSFNLFIPDLVFFGKSYSRSTGRSVEFQARSIVEGLKRLGCDGGFSVYSLSYGGYIAYWMAKNYQEMINKVVIVSTGVGFTQQEKMTEMKKHGRDVSEILVPRSPRDLRQLVKLSMNTGLPFLDWIPDFIFSQVIALMYETNRQGLVELAKNLQETEEEPFSAISQETLIVWGDKDKVFPLEHGRRLHGYLPKSSLKILKEIGHAVNIEAPTTLNSLIISFVGA